MVASNSVADPVLPRQSAVQFVSAPTQPQLSALLHATGRAADQILKGRYDYLLLPGGVPTEDRWFVRLPGELTEQPEQPGKAINRIHRVLGAARDRSYRLLFRGE
jgi:hypothetical protein